MTKKELEKKINELERNQDKRVSEVSKRVEDLFEKVLGVDELTDYFYSTGTVTIPKKEGRLETLEKYLGIEYVEKETKEKFYKKL